ncbi:hypothetical protein B0H19DRAFT_1190320 [Mycena capillaripes]|nr:hypothetical protein B0H19DRAFT_1190320 [Mycena capillaripes]
MLTFFAVLATLYIRSILAAGGAADFVVVSDPVGVVQCDEYTLQWTGGVGPFSVQVTDPVETGDIYFFNAVVLENSIVWPVDKLGISITPTTFPLPFIVSVTDMGSSQTFTSRAETVQAATIPLDASGLCTSLVPAGSSNTNPTDTTSSSSSTTSPSPPSQTSTPDAPTSPTGFPTKSGFNSKTSSASSGKSSPSSSSAADASAASGTATTPKKISSGAIAGGVVGGVILIALLGIIFAFLRRRHQKALLEDLTAHDYHLELHVGEEKPLPAFYEPIKPSSTPPPHPHPSSGYYHDASPSVHSHPSSGYLPESQPYHDAPYPPPQHIDVAAQQMELERQINVMQQEINGMQYAAHTQALQNQVNTMRGELERLRMPHAQTGYR